MYNKVMIIFPVVGFFWESFSAWFLTYNIQSRDSIMTIRVAVRLTQWWQKEKKIEGPSPYLPRQTDSMTKMKPAQASENARKLCLCPRKVKMVWIIQRQGLQIGLADGLRQTNLFQKLVPSQTETTPGSLWATQDSNVCARKKKVHVFLWGPQRWRWVSW